MTFSVPGLCGQLILAIYLRQTAPSENLSNINMYPSMVYNLGNTWSSVPVTSTGVPVKVYTMMTTPVLSQEILNRKAVDSKQTLLLDQ